MAKMFWELELPIAIGKMKEDLSRNNIWKYLRYFRMYVERFKLQFNEKDITYNYFSKVLFGGVVGLINDPVYGICAGSVDIEEKDPDGNPVLVTFNYDNNKKRKHCKVGEDVVLGYADGTRIPPVLYIVAIANQVITREDIINQQDNMLRKPIVVAGSGEEFDNAVNNAENVLSGVSWINTKKKNRASKKGTILEDSAMEVLNLQVGNAYKGGELWESRKQWEELLCDYMGYTTTKNEKKERMNTLEVENENSIGKTFYESAKDCVKECIKEAEKVFGVKGELELRLEREEGGEDNGSSKNDVE